MPLLENLTSSYYAVYRKRRTFNKSFSREKNMTLQVNCWKNKRTEMESSLIKSLSEKLVNSALFGSGRTSTNLIMPALFSSVASRSHGISTCVKGGVAHCKRWFWVKLALITFISTFTTAVDNSTICTNKLLFFLCGTFSLFGVVV